MTHRSDLDRYRLAMLNRIHKDAGWNPDSLDIAINPIKLWLYSVNLEAGPRLVTQVGVRLYRSMMSRRDLMEDLVRRFPQPGDILADTLCEYDALPAPDERSRQALSLFLAFYAISTRTWQLVKPLSEVEGAHFFVFDWKTRGGTTVLRPAHHHQACPMGEDDIASLFDHVLRAHLRLHPGDAP